MISIPYSSIPHYLRRSQFYQALDSEEIEGSIQIPQEYYLQEEAVESDNDLFKMLKVMLFWGLDRIPNAMIEYSRNHPVEELGRTVDDHEQAILSDLRSIFSSDIVPTADIVSRAVLTDRIELVEYVANCADIKKDCSLGAATAAKVGNLPFLQILHNAGHRWDHTTTDEAARGGYLHCLQYAHEHGCRVDVSANTFAAEGGHLACLQYSHTIIGTAWHRDVCSAAASRGHYDVLTYAHRHGCPWDDLTVENAARGNHLRCLQYALEQCCPVAEYALIAACLRGYYDCVVVLCDYLLPEDRQVLSAAATGGSLQCVTFLREAGWDWSAQAIDNAARHGHYEILRYLLDNGYPHSDKPLYLAAGQ